MAKKPFRREDIPGIDVNLPDMVTPEGAAAALGVPMSKLRARQVLDKTLGPPKNVLMNDFYTKTLLMGTSVHISMA